MMNVSCPTANSARPKKFSMNAEGKRRQSLAWNGFVHVNCMYKSFFQARQMTRIGARN
jgi:hypothetical protein